MLNGWCTTRKHPQAVHFRGGPPSVKKQSAPVDAARCWMTGAMALSSLALLALNGGVAASAAKNTSYPFQDPALPLEHRIDDLIGAIFPLTFHVFPRLSRDIQLSCRCMLPQVA